MSRFTIHCRCGEQFHLDERSVGRRVKCRCGRVLEVKRRRTSLAERLRRMVRALRVGVAAALRRRPPAARPVATSLSMRTLSIVTWAYLTSVCAIAAVMWGLGDLWWPATAVLFIGRWVFLLPLLVLVPAAAMSSRRLLVPLAVAAFIVVDPIMGTRTGWRRLLSTPPGTRFRVVSFNVAGGAPLAGDMERVLAELRPDVLAMQECGSALAASLAEVKGWEHHDAVGLCLVSRYPIRQASVMDRSTLEAAKRAGDIGGSGAVVRYVIETPSGPIQLTNLHLETPRKGLERLRAFDVRTLRLNTYLRGIESELARRWVDAGVRDAPVPFLVVGDFNTPVESRIFQQYWGDLTDAFSRVGAGLGMTKYNGWIRVRIDHVLLGPGWQADRALVGEDLGSDHRPAIADVRLPARR